MTARQRLASRFWMNTSYVAGANDQVIFSAYNGSAYTQPVSISALTPSKRQFLIETLGVSQDPDYLLRTMIEQGAYSFVSQGFGYGYFNTAYLQLFQMSYNGNTYVGSNDDPYNQSQTPANCAIYYCLFDAAGGQWTMYVYAELIETVFDYSIFDATTVVLANEIDKVEAGTSTIDNLLDIIEGVVGAISCNGIETDQVDVFDSVHSFSYFKTNTCTFAVLARYLNGFKTKEIKHHPNKNFQFRASKVKGVWWAPFYHASIRDDEAGRWFSGFPNQPQTLLFGFVNIPDDHPEKTLIVGFISTTQSSEVTLSTLQSATAFYDNRLNYNLDPLPFTSSYNSNGYAQGLVNLIGTIVPVSAYNEFSMSHPLNIPINTIRFPGLFKPVSKSEFGF